MRSRANAVTHGITARTVTYIPRGLMREDPTEVEAFVMAIVESLRPQNHLAEDRARHIANLLLRQRRSRLWEVLGLAGMNQDIDQATHLGLLAQHKEFAAATVTQLDDADLSLDELEMIAGVYLIGAGLEEIEGWTERKPPSTVEGWREVINRILTLRWTSPEQASEWASSEAAKLRALEAQHRGPAMETAARTIVEDGFIDKLLNLEVRVSKELARAIQDFSDFQKIDPSFAGIPPLRGKEERDES